MEAIVKFTKIGNCIKYRLPFKMYCNSMKTFIPNSGTYPKTDGVFRVWLGKDIDKLFKRRQTIYKKVELCQIYDNCDVPKG